MAIVDSPASGSKNGTMSSPNSDPVTLTNKCPCINIYAYIQLHNVIILYYAPLENPKWCTPATKVNVIFSLTKTNVLL